MEKEIKSRDQLEENSFVSNSEGSQNGRGHKESLYNRMVLTVMVITFRIISALKKQGRRLPPGRGEVKSVLLISSTGLGDTIVATPSIAVARRVWPGAKIYALIHRRWATLFSACPDLDGIIVYPGKFKGVLRLIFRLRGLKPDLALILDGNDPDIVPLAYLSGAGFLAGSGRSRFAFLLDQPLVFSNPDSHSIQKRLEVIQAAAGPVEPQGRVLFIPREKRIWAENYWRDRGLRSEEKLLVFNPGGSKQAKQWPEEHWLEVGRQLNSLRNVRLALFGSLAEQDYMRELADGMGPPGALIEARPDILETAALLERADLVFGPDSGLAHVAQALNRPALIMFGPSSPGKHGRFLNNALTDVLVIDRSMCPDLGHCKKKVCRPNVCMTFITPDMALEAIERKFDFPLDRE